MPESRGARLADLKLLGWQVLYEQRAFWRDRRRAISSFAMPLMFLAIFGAIIPGRLPSLRNLPIINFYVPGIIAYAVMVLGFTNVAMTIAYLRSEGILKRLRATPLPLPTFLLGVVISTVVTILLATGLLIAIGVLAYGARFNAATLPGFLLTLILASACFTSLGIAVSRLIGSPDSGMPVLMFVTLPLSFISNVFIPLEHAKAVLAIGRLFPLYHVAHGLQPSFEPWAKGTGLSGPDLWVLLIWSAAGFVAMVKATRVLSAKD